MIESGTILAIEDAMLRVRIDRDPENSACTACGLCRRGSEDEGFAVLSPASDAFRVGDRVRVEVIRPSGAITALLLFGLPLAMLLLGGGLARCLRPGEDGLMILAGLAGVALGFAVVAAMTRYIPALRPRAQILGLDLAPSESYSSGK